MSALTSLQARVERYLVERRRLGFSDHSQKYALRSFARHVQAVSHRGPLTVEVMADWARRDRRGSADRLTWARRLKRLRSFLRWLQQFEPRTEVPDDRIFGRLSTASVRSSIFWPPRGGLGQHLACAESSSKRCSV
jgi:hypothetical protein